MDPENFSYQRDSPHANAVEVPDSFQAGILLSAVESFQKRRYGRFFGISDKGGEILFSVF